MVYVYSDPKRAGEEDYYLSDDERCIYYHGKRIVGPVRDNICRICGHEDSETLHNAEAFNADGAEEVAEFYGRAPWAVLHEFTPFDCPRDAVMRELAEYVERGGYYPNVWAISDHGNPTLISVLECGCYFTEHGGDASKHPTTDGQAKVQP